MALRTITNRISMSLLVEGEAVSVVPSVFRYEPSDGFAVHIAMSAAGSVVEWSFAREILAEGLHAPAGLGDVHVYPCLDLEGAAAVHLRFGSPEGEAVLEVSAGELAYFLNETYTAVPSGSEIEHLDIESALIGLLADR
jgi:hypothetical protein